MFYCGIDIAKYKHEASVIDTNGKSLLDSISFANDKQGCEKIIAVFQKFEISPADVIIFPYMLFSLSLDTMLRSLTLFSPKLSEKCISVRLKMTLRIHISSLR